MIKKLLAIAIIGVTLRCGSNKTEDLETINVDVSNVKSVNLEEIANDLSIIPIRLPNDKYIGDVTYIRKIDGYYYILDRDVSLSITILDSKGNYINQLKNVGYGPEEYSNVENFMVTKENELVVYDRERLRLVNYSLPDLKYIKAVKVKEYWMGMEAINENWIVAVNDSDTDRGEYKGVQIIELASMEARHSNFGDYPMAIEASIDQSITKGSNGVFYTHPGEFTTVYRVKETGFDPYLKINFGSYAIEQENWKTDDIGEFMQIMSQEEKVAAAFGYIEGNRKKSFWYMHKSYAGNYLAILDDENKASSYKNIKVDGLKITLSYPRGIVDDQYFHVIRKSEIDLDFLDQEQNKNSPFSDVYKSNSDDETPFLLTYQLK